MQNFAAATAVTPRPGNADEFDVSLDAQWGVDTKVHGGYLLAVLGRAAGQAAGDEHPHLAAMSASFLQPPAPGPAVVSVQRLRKSKTMTQLRARLVQDDRPIIEALINHERLEEADPYWSRLSPVELPPPEECFHTPVQPPGTAFSVPLMEVVEVRLDMDVIGFAFGEPSRRGLVSGWQQLADGSDWDPLSLLVALDMLPTTSYDLALPGWLPTIQFTGYIRRLPAPGPVRVRKQATDVGKGRMDELVHIWDSKDRLVAQATVLAAIRIPE